MGSKPEHAVQTWVQDLNGGAPQPITPEGIAGTRLSPVGKFLCPVDEVGMIWFFPIAGVLAAPV